MIVKQVSVIVSFGQIVLGALCILVILLVYEQSLPQINQQRMVRTYVNSPWNSEPKVILLWTDMFGVRDWYLPGLLNNKSFFEAINCPVTNCFVTDDRKALEDITDFDVVMFHAAEPFSLIEPVPPTRAYHQLYVFAVKESPAHTKHQLSDENDFYNLTMTYRLDSDLLWAYGYVQDIETGQIVAPRLRPNWRKPPDRFQMDHSLEAMLFKKNKTAGWFVSHCGVTSDRDALVKALQKYIQVDKYGLCGTSSCPRNSDECNQKLDYEYKFYLSFENSLCTDYVTEKLFRTLDRNIIPIVYGGADYSRFAPPLSYINADDFETVEDLAMHLRFLEQNPEEYKKYFWWKKYYKHVDYTPFCDLCVKLNRPAQHGKVQYYTDIREWWIGHQCRLKPKIQF